MRRRVTLKMLRLEVLFIVLLALLPIFAGIGIVSAQEPEPEETPVVFVTGEAPETTNPVDTAVPVVIEVQTVADYYNLIIPVAAAFFGVLVGGGGAAVIFARLNKDKELKDTTEALLAASIPQSALSTINTVSVRALDVLDKIINPALEFVGSVTDGEPNELTIENPDGAATIISAQVQG